MKRLLLAASLLCALSLTTIGGQIPTDGFAPPPPPTGSTPTSSATAPGDMPGDDFAQQATASVRLTLVTTLVSLLSR